MIQQHKRWTASRLMTFEPTTSPITDPATKGLQFLVREAMDGTISRTFLHRYKFRGEETRISVGPFPDTSLDEARKIVHEHREHMRNGIDPRGTNRRRVRALGPIGSAPLDSSNQAIMENICADFMANYVRIERKRPEYVEAILKRDILTAAGWAGRDVRTITPREVVALTNRIKSRGSPVMANRTFSIIHQLFRYAVSELNDPLMQTTPTAHLLIRRPGGKEKPRKRCLNNTEISALLACLDKLDGHDDARRSPLMAVALRILLLTAQRRGELIAARWSEVDFERKAWVIPEENSKTGDSHLVPLSDAALKEFKRLKAAAAPRAVFVFPNAADGSGAMDPKLLTRLVARNRKAFMAAGIAPFTVHDLRRTVRTGLTGLRINRFVAERVLAHKLAGMEEVYDQWEYEDLTRDALDKWAAHVKSLTAGEAQ